MFKHERLNIKAAFYWDYAADNGNYVNFIESIYMIAGDNDETTCNLVHAHAEFPNNYITYQSFEIKYYYTLNLFHALCESISY